ncbi:MAG: peptidase MA family metallohydrolase [Dehalococcoidia bacterium]
MVEISKAKIFKCGIGFLFGFFFYLLCYQILFAQSTYVSATSILTRDPLNASFVIDIEDQITPQEVRFFYKILNPYGDISGDGIATVNRSSDRIYQAVFAMEMISADRYIPVGSHLLVHWEIYKKDGENVSTDEERLVFLDGRYEWQSFSEDRFSVYWYGPKNDDAMRSFLAMKSAILETEALLKTNIEYPVKLIMWRSPQEGELAQRPRSAVYDSSVTTEGQRVAPDLIFAFQPAVGVVRHEAAHLVTKVAGDGPFTRVPAWLDEGTAVYMQGDLGPYKSAVQRAIASDKTLNLRSLTAPSNDPNLVNLFYGQSWSTVDYLISQNGEDLFAELFSSIKAGNPIDDALNKIYGFDTNELYNQWRNANDLKSIVFSPISTSNNAINVPVATRVPLSIPTQVNVAPSSGITDSRQSNLPESMSAEEKHNESASNSIQSIGLIIVIGTVLLSLFLIILGIFVWKWPSKKKQK